MEIKTHPIFDAYEFNTDGQYRKIGKTNWLIGNCIGDKGYLQCTVKKNGEKQSRIYVSRGVWESFRGPISEDEEIDHIDNDPKNNKLENLQCITIDENRKKRNHDFLIAVRENRHEKMRKIKGINKITEEEHIFGNKTQAGNYYGCSAGLVYNICEGKNRCKTFGGNITFRYAGDEEVDVIVPNKRIGKKYNKKTPALTEEQKKENHKIAMKKSLLKKKEKNKKI